MAEYTMIRRSKSKTNRDLFLISIGNTRVLWLGIVLRRAEMVSLEDQRAIEERLTMYDDLFENDPKMKRLRAEWEARGKMEGEIEGEVKTLRKVIVKTVK